MSNYIVLFVGIQLAAIILIFGQMFTPLLDDYAELVENSMIAKYQYVMSAPMETENEQAEKYCMAGLETTDERYMTDEISVYGIQENSRYIDADISQGKVLASNGVMDKFGLKEGDTITLKDHYEDKNYDFVVQACYDYDAGMAIFMPREDYLSCFDEDGDSFTGYFTNEKLTDVPDEAVATIITREDLTKLSRQLKVSMGENMKLFDAFGVIMCVLLMYIISKQIIEKNKQSISMTKILGFRDGEIGGLYLVATSAVVIVSLLAAVPITDRLLAWMFSSYLYTEMSGYIPYMVSKNCFLFMILVGILCYAFVAVTQMWKIRRIPKSDALKNVE
jgi:putative ABC transport system permease protein